MDPLALLKQAQMTQTFHETCMILIFIRYLKCILYIIFWIVDFPPKGTFSQIFDRFKVFKK